MADGTRVREPGPGPGVETVDTHDVDFGAGDVRARQRVSLAGTTAGSDVPVTNDTPDPASNGLVVRTVGPVSAQFTDENGVVFSEANPLPVSVGDLTVQQLTVAFPDSEVSTLNSTAGTLGAGATFTGDWEEVTRFAAISAIVLTDQYSAINGAKVQFSHDGVMVLRTVSATIPPNSGLTFLFSPEARYFRITYTNGATAQSVFSTQVLLHYQPPAPPQLPLAATTTDVSLAQSTAAHVKGRQTSGLWTPIKVDANGALSGTNDIPFADFDPNNTHAAPFAANETYTGQWTEYGPIPGMNTLFLMDSQPVSVSIEWSADGINKDTSILGTTPVPILPGTSLAGTWSGTYISNLPVNKYYRLKIVNGPTAGTTFGHARMWRLRAPFGGSFSTLSSVPTNASVALLTRAIQSGTSPDGTFTNIPVGGHDPFNSTQTGLAAAGTFTGTYKSSLGLSSILAFGITDQPLTIARIRWSRDGSTTSPSLVNSSDMISTVQVLDNPTAGPTAKVYVYLVVLTTMVDKFYRLELTNGATPTSLFCEFDTWTYDKPFTGSFSSLTSTLSNISTALLTRAVQAGTLPDGTFTNQVFGGADPDQSPQLQKDGSGNPAPVLLTAGATFTGPWANVEGFTDIAALVRSDVDGTTYLDYSMDGTTQDRTFPYPITGGANADWISAAPRGKFFRFRYVNGAAPQTVFRAQVQYATTPFGDQFGRLATVPTDDTIVATTRGINAGRKPDGSYVNQPETGVSALNNTPTPLAANATWIGAWELCDQYSDVAVNVRSDVQGTLVVDFSQDMSGVDRQSTFLYSQFPAGSTFAVPVQARFVRVSYVNAGTIQTVMRLQTRLLEEGLDGATMPLAETVSDTTMAQVDRSVLTGKSPDGTYHNVKASNTGGLFVDVEALQTVLFGSYTVNTSAGQIVNTGFANRRSVSFKADPGNSGIVYLGQNSSVTTANGYPLNPGDSLDVDAATGVSFYAVGSKVNQRVATLEIGSP